MAVALIVAAGRGERLGSGRPKALVPLAGRPMLAWSVAALRAVEEVRRIVIALPAGELDAAPEGTLAVAGGAERSHSVRAALAAAFPGPVDPFRDAPPGDRDDPPPGDPNEPDDPDDPHDPDEPVIVHDAARPLAEASLFRRALAELAAAPDVDAVIAAAPVTDTIKEVERAGTVVRRTLDRSVLWAVQTPQVFRRRALEDVLSAADEAQLAAATDDALLIERAGGTVRILAADSGNLKITTLHDLRVAELVLAERAAGEPVG